MLKKNREGLFDRHADRGNLIEQMRKGTLFQHQNPITTLPTPIQHSEEECFLNDISLGMWEHEQPSSLPILKPRYDFQNKQTTLYSSFYVQGREKRGRQWSSKQEQAKENPVDHHHRKICFEEKLERTTLRNPMEIHNRSLKRSLHAVPALLCLKGRDYHKQLRQLKQIVGTKKQFLKKKTYGLHHQYGLHQYGEKQGACVPAFLLRPLQMQWPI